jgi:hypothetical protein
MLGFKLHSQTESDICRLVVTIICSLTPDAPNDDKCMPSLLVKYSTKLKAGTPQPDENYERGGSCAFDAARIKSYEKANLSFKTDTLQLGGDSLPKLRDLLGMDLALFTTEPVNGRLSRLLILARGLQTMMTRIMKTQLSRMPLQHQMKQMKETSLYLSETIMSL